MVTISSILSWFTIWRRGKGRDCPERKTNAEIVATFMQAGSAIEAFAQAGNTDFNSIAEIDSYTATLQDQLQKVAVQMTENPDAEVYAFGLPEPDYGETYEAIKDLAGATFQYFEQQRLVTPRVETIEVQPQPASVLAYTLYGDSTRADEIMTLNELTDNFVLSGEIKVLSE